MEIQLYLNKTIPVLSNFLNEVLPKVCGDWWQVCVIDKLSESQRIQIDNRRINSLELLDLAALLRIFNNNWKEISYIKKLPDDVRNYALEILTIRHKFAHSSSVPPLKEDAERYADTIYRLVKALDRENELIIEIKEFINSQKSLHSIISKRESEIENSIKKKKINPNKDEPIGKLVHRYVNTILEFCFSKDETELIKLQDKDSSNELFGINYPFMIEVERDSEKIDRYWKNKFSFKDRHFVITSEWYKWNRKKFINYLNDNNLWKLPDCNFIVSKQVSSFIEEEHKLGDINVEIEKVHKRIPKWFRSPKQINSKILIKYLEMKGIQEFVLFSDLEHNLRNIKTFKENYNSMKNFGERNHARVFHEIYGKVYLWKPVNDFILFEYKSIL